MIKKLIAIIALIGIGMVANISTASAHQGWHSWYGNPYKVLKPKQVRHKLRHRGYRAIKFTDRWLPVYKVRACKNGKRFKMRLNRFGNIMWRKRVGWC